MLSGACIMWTDAHAHLGELDDARLAEVVWRAAAAGLRAVVNTGTDLRTSHSVVAQHQRHPMLLPAVGISPFDSERLEPGWQDQLASLAAQPTVVAVGETGLDTTNPRYPAAHLQLPLLHAQARIAMDSGLPLVVHSRGAELRVVDECLRLGLTRVLFHCFTADMAAMRAIVQAGYHVSISGIVTFARSDLAQIAAEVPAERLLLETDSPYLAPVPCRGRTNEPSFLPSTAAAVARARGVAPEELARSVKAAFDSFFGRRHA
jgi:TatD DNase family protein